MKTARQACTPRIEPATGRWRSTLRGSRAGLAHLACVALVAACGAPGSNDAGLRADDAGAVDAGPGRDGATPREDAPAADVPAIGDDAATPADAATDGATDGATDAATPPDAEPPRPGDETRLGLHFTDGDVARWRARIAAGRPYVHANDASPGSPGDWDRIRDRAETFVTSFVRDRAGGACPAGTALEPTTGVCHTEHDLYDGRGTEIDVTSRGNGVRDAAFAALVEGDTPAGARFARAAWAAINAQTRRSTAPCEGAFNDTSCFFMPDFLLKLLYAYDYVKDRFPAAERARVDGWFRARAAHFAAQLQTALSMNFPNRLAGDYAARGRAALAPDFRTEYTHRAPGGTPVNRIAGLPRWYNNRRAAQAHFVGQVGVFLDDAELVLHARTYFTEWLRFGLYPDGMQGEYERNEADRTHAGVFYGAINIASAAWFADALARRGDCSLYQYETNDGLFGTERLGAAGQPKSIHLAARTHYDMVDGTLERYVFLAPSVRIDSLSEAEGMQWLADTWYVPANVFYREARFTAVYTRRARGAPAYNAARVGSAGPFGAPWGGWAFQLPGVLFMFGQMEGTAWPYPSRPMHRWPGGRACPAIARAGG